MMELVDIVYIALVSMLGVVNVGFAVSVSKNKWLSWVAVALCSIGIFIVAL